MTKSVAVVCALVLSAGDVSFAQKSKTGKLAQNTSPAFGTLKQLVGEWSGTGRNRNPVETMFRHTSGSSVIVGNLHLANRKK